MEKINLIGILSILYDYSITKRVLDIKAIREIIKIYLAECGLKNLVRDVVFIHFDDSKISGYYDEENRIILLSLDLKMNNNVYAFGYNESEFTTINLINQAIIVNVFHELNHALRFNVKHSKTDFVDLIIKESYKIACSDFQLYENLHDYFPYEKEANIFGYETCISLYQDLNNHLLDNYGLNNLYINFIKTIVNGYNFDIFMDNPLKNVILSSTSTKEELKITKYLLIKGMIKLNGMNLYDRLRYGFPITKEEYDYTLGVFYNIMTYNHDNSFEIKKILG